MKKRILVILVVLVVLVLALPIANLVIGPPGGVDLVPDAVADPSLQAAAKVLETKCVGCHTAEAKLPFYASFPVAESIIREDIAAGTQALDYKTAFADAVAKPAGEVVLAKTQYAIESGSMPPFQYLALHWDGGLGEGEQKTLLSWIAEVRAAHYATPGAPAELVTGPLQPLPKTVDVDARKVALGDKLFHDKRLSADDTLSCASCHGLDKGGTDQAPVSTGVGGQKGPINSPTVYNAAYGLAQFWDGRAADLFEQAGGPVNNPMEMGSNWPQAIGKLSQDADFVAAFTAVYPDGLNDVNLRDAIAEFERSLVTPNSPFDRFLLGEADALTAQQKAGYERFVAMGCGTCHVGRAIGGQSFERMGGEREYFTGEVREVDAGRFNVTKDERDRHRFKVPTLRNVAVTFPYFHDASAADLAAAVRTMAGVQTDQDLGDTEVAELVAFLESLTGEYQGKPLK